MKAHLSESFGIIHITEWLSQYTVKVSRKLTYPFIPDIPFHSDKMSIVIQNHIKHVSKTSGLLSWWAEAILTCNVDILSTPVLL